MKGEFNPADLLTKNVNKLKKDLFISKCGQEARAGRASKALDFAGDQEPESRGEAEEHSQAVKEAQGVRKTRQRRGSVRSEGVDTG